MRKYSFKDSEFSAFCLGCAQFGQKYGINNEKSGLGNYEAKSIINKSIESGINFFDTASDYGKSEEILGNLLKPHKNLVIATKIKHIKGNTKNSNMVKREIKNSLESSLKKLQRNYLDIVYIHQYSLFFEYPDIFLEILNIYKKKGLIKHIGISLYEPKEADKTLKYKEISVFQIPYSVLNRDFEKSDTISLLKKKDKLITLRSIFSQGLIFMEPGILPEYFSPIKRTLSDFYDEIKKYFKSKEEFFLGYVLNKNYGPVILGVYSLPQLINNLNVFNLSLEKSIFKKIEDKIPNINKVYTDPRSWILK